LSALFISKYIILGGFCICEGQTGYIIPVLRNGVDEIYVMEYRTYQERKNYLKELYNMHIKSKN